MNRYEQLASVLEAQFDQGIIGPGERLRSVRELSITEGVSPGTVVLAYELLRERGRIESHERSGYFACARRSEPVEQRRRPSLAMHRPSTLDADELAAALRQAAFDPRVLPLGIATPAQEYLPYRAVSRAVARALREEPALTAEYRFPPGSAAFRKEVVRRYSHYGVRSDESAVVTTAGAAESITLALQVVARPGDVVAIESPTYFGIIQAVRALGYEIIELPLHPTRGLEPERLQEAVAKVGRRLKAAVVVPHHSNPLGTSMSESAKAELVAIAAKAGVVLLEDDVYGDLSFGKRPKPLKALDTDDNVILCGSFAKTISPALRAGFAVSDRYAGDIAARRAALASGSPALAEEALTIVLRDGGYERHLQRVRRQFRTLVARFTDAILASFPKGTRVSSPTGGYVLWVQLPGGVDARRVQQQALERRIGVASGTLFSIDGRYGDCVRLSCALPFVPRVERGIAQLGKIVAGLVKP